MGEPQLAEPEANEASISCRIKTEKARSEAEKWAQDRVDRLGAQLAVLQEAYRRKQEILAIPDAGLVAGVERWYSAAEAATFFARTPAWIYDRLAKEKFRYKDGTPIKPVMVGDGPKPRMRFNLELLQSILLSMYRDGTVKIEELKLIKRRIDQGEFDEMLYDPDTE
jgi:hypothetical protein